MATIQDLIERTLRFAPDQALIDRLAANVATGNQGDSVSINFVDASKWGAPVDVQIDSEVFHVTSIDPAARVATATRGFYDTTPASHSSASAVVRIAPRFYRQDILDALTDGIRKMCPPLFQVKATNLTFNSGTVGYALPADCLDVYRVWAQTVSSTNAWRELFSYDVVREMDTSLFTNGIGLLLAEGGVGGLPIRVQYKAAFTDPTVEADNLQTTLGLQPYMFDIPVWYAVSTLLPPDEVIRTSSRSAVQASRADQVPPTTVTRAAEYFRARYELAMQDAVARHNQLFPTRMRIIR